MDPMQSMMNKEFKKNPPPQIITLRDKSNWDLAGFAIGFFLGIFLLVSFWFLAWVGAVNKGTYQNIVCSFPS